MCDLHVHAEQKKNTRNYDPTHTTVLRNTFANDVKKRFTKLNTQIKDAIITGNMLNGIPTAVQVGAAPRYTYPHSSWSLSAFNKWVQEQVDKGIFDVYTLQGLSQETDAEWADQYIMSAYKKGVRRAYTEARPADLDITRGLDYLVEASLTLPVHAEKVRLLFSRTFTDLKGITDDMSSKISRILAEGMAKGVSPREMVDTIAQVLIGKPGDSAQKLVGRFIDARRRAEILARTEVIRAHHMGMIQQYREWEVVDLYVKAEWTTAGDSRVCPECKKLEGVIFTLDEVEDLIPLHPQCRCIALPYVPEEEN